MVRYLGFKCKLFCCEGIDFGFKSGVCVYESKCCLEKVFGMYGDCRGWFFDYGM